MENQSQPGNTESQAGSQAPAAALTKEPSEEQRQELLAALRSHGDELLDGNGHQVISARYYLKRGVPEVYVLPAWGWHPSGEGKAALYNSHTGEPVEGTWGINNLEWLYFIARAVGATDYGDYFGRGTQAQAISEAIEKVVRPGLKEND